MGFLLLDGKGWIYGILVLEGSALFLEGNQPQLPPPVLLLEENPVSKQPSTSPLLEGSGLFLEDL